jgi:hypothetical protein
VCLIVVGGGLDSSTDERIHEGVKQELAVKMSHSY